MLYTEVALLDAVRQYLHETLGVTPCIHEWDGARELPYALRDAFDLYATQLLGHEVVLAVRRATHGPIAPADVTRRVARIEAAADRPVVYVTSTIPAFERQRLVALKQPFIVPAAQLYLPDLGVDFRARVRGVRREAPETFAPATQALLIQRLLLGPWSEAWNVTDAAAGLHYTPMTASRAARELVAAKGFTEERRGRHRMLRPVRDRRETWEFVRARLRTPVAYRLWTLPEQPVPNVVAPLAGLSALSALTMLRAPMWPIRAIEASAAGAIEGRRVGRVRAGEPVPDGPVYEVWRYSPSLTGGGQTVDPLSLLLSVDAVEDARVQGALQELEEALPW